MAQEVRHPVFQMGGAGTMGGALTCQFEVEQPGSL